MKMRAWSLSRFLTGNWNIERAWFLLLILSLLTSVILFPVSVCLAGSLNCQAAVVVDASTGKILYEKDPNRRLLPASTAKLITAIVAIENKDLSEIVTISKRASHVSPSKAGFKEGGKVSMEGLLYAALIKSANDAAVALAEAVAGSEEHFVHLMNREAISIGATNTRFINSTGLPGRGQHITALDLSRIMSYALKYPKLREIMGTPIAQVSTEEGQALSLKNTDKLLWSDEEIIGGKTGYTASAKHCFVCAAKHEKRTIIVALLGSQSRKELWKDAEKLISKGFEEGIHRGDQRADRRRGMKRA